MLVCVVFFQNFSSLKKPLFMKKLLLVPAALMALTFTACRETTPAEDAALPNDTAVLAPNGNPTAGELANQAGNAVDDWTDVDYNGPVTMWDDVNDKDIETRGNDNYGIYSLGENVMFKTDSDMLSADAKAKIKKVGMSIGKRYANANIRIMGFADSRGTAGYNKELSEKRAEAVKAELISSGLDMNKVTVYGMGEASPVATNDTKAGMAENRRVQIVARKS